MNNLAVSGPIDTLIHSVMNPEFTFTFIFLTIVFVLILSYSMKLIFHGRTRYHRVDRQQGSALLSKSLMEMFYWGLQPVGDFFIFLRISAHSISYLSLLLGVTAGVALAFGHFGEAGFYSAISAMLDAVDGMVARKTGTASDSGEILDASVDRYVEFFFLGGLILHYQQDKGMLILTLAALIGSFMVSYSSAKAEALQVTPPRGAMRRPERALYLTLGAILAPISNGQSMVFALALVGLFANGSALKRLYVIAQTVKA